MWKKLPYSTPFYILFTQENGFFIYITDYISIWWVYFNENDFLSCLKESNEDLEMEDVNQLIQIGVKMLMHPEELKKLQLSNADKLLHVSMISSAKFPVCLSVSLTEGSKEMFYRNVTQKLLKIVHDLKASENELRNSLIKKDKEIEEYKSETDVRLARYLKTAVYHDEQHMMKHAMYQKMFGCSDVPENLIERLLDKQEDQVIITQLKQKIKVEPESQQSIKCESFCPSIKLEGSSQVTETAGMTSSAENGAIKREAKCEPTVVSPKKKTRIKLKL